MNFFGWLFFFVAKIFRMQPCVRIRHPIPPDCSILFAPISSFLGLSITWHISSMGGGHGGGRGGERGGDGQGGGHQQELGLWSCHSVHPQHTYDLLVAYESVREAASLLLISFASPPPPQKKRGGPRIYIMCSVAVTGGQVRPRECNLCISTQGFSISATLGKPWGNNPLPSQNNYFVPQKGLFVWNFCSREKRAGNNLYQELSFQEPDALGEIDEGADLTGEKIEKNV